MSRRKLVSPTQVDRLSSSQSWSWGWGEGDTAACLCILTNSLITFQEWEMLTWPCRSSCPRNVKSSSSAFLKRLPQWQSSSDKLLWVAASGIFHKQAALMDATIVFQERSMLKPLPGQVAFICNHWDTLGKHEKEIKSLVFIYNRIQN